MLRAYFDDSGTHEGSPVVIWAGFMADVAEWTLFEQEWAALLKHHGLRRFHMTEIENGFVDGQHWPRARIDSVVHDFRQAICRRNLIGVASSVRAADWETTIRGTSVEERLISPIFLAFEHTVQQALHWAHAAAVQTGIADKVELFFDLREKEAAKGRDLAQAYASDAPWTPWFAGAHFVRMSEALPLQAADMLAWETFTLERARAQNGSNAPIRTHLASLLRDAPVYGQFYNAKALGILASQMPATGRPDLMRPQGVTAQRDGLTTVQYYQVLKSLRLLDGKGIDVVKYYLDNIPAEEREAAGQIISDLLAEIRRFYDLPTGA